MIRLLQLDDVRSLTGIPRNTLYVLIRKGSFPAPIKVSARRRAWRSDELASWIEERTKQSRPAQPAIV